MIDDQGDVQSESVYWADPSRHVSRSSDMATLLPNSRVARRVMKGYRVFLFSHDHPHPPHIHVGKRKRYSSWNLDRLECVDGGGFSMRELSLQRSLLVEQRQEIIRSWHEHWDRQNQDR
jgi:hypothetical protein